MLAVLVPRLQEYAGIRPSNNIESPGLAIIFSSLNWYSISPEIMYLYSKASVSTNGLVALGSRLSITISRSNDR